MTLPVPGAAPGTPGAVSYTHLDVYKRQVLIAEPVILAADRYESEEILRWLADHITDFTGETKKEIA